MSDKVENYLARKAAGQADQAAGIQASIEGRKRVFIPVTIDLSTAKDQYDPLVVDFQFKTFWVVSATDANASVSMIPNMRSEGQLNQAIPLKLNLSEKYGFPVSGAQLYWSAQAGKTMTIHFYVDADVTPGSQITQISGGVAISEGSSIVTAGLGAAGNAKTVTLTAGAATLVAPQDTTRFVATLEATVDVRVGDSSVDGTSGNFYPAGSKIIWKNTAALYMYAAAAGTASGNVEK